MASLERLSEVPELMFWFREGLARQGVAEDEIARCELELLADLAEEDRRRQRRGRRRLAHREQLRIDDC